MIHTVDFQGDKAGYLYYVSVIDGGQYGFLLGPYRTHAEAEANVPRAKGLAREADDRAFWYAYGTAGAPDSVRIQTVFGI